MSCAEEGAHKEKISVRRNHHEGDIVRHGCDSICCDKSPESAVVTVQLARKEEER